MALLLLTAGVSPGYQLVINSTSTFAALSNFDMEETTLWHIDPVLRTILSTTTITGMSHVVGVSPDGSHVFGMNSASNAVMWTSGSTSLLPQSGSGTYPQIAQMNGMSADGIPVGEFDHLNGDMSAVNATAAYWPSPFSGFGTYPGSGYSHQSFFASSGASKIVGRHLNLQSDFFYTIFKWDSGGSSATLLPVGPDGNAVFVNGISQTNGDVVIGNVYFPTLAAKWDASNTLTIIGVPGIETTSDTFGVSDDGVTIGVTVSGNLYRWTSGGGFVTTGANDTNATMSGGGDKIFTSSLWIDEANVITSTGLADGKMIAADGRSGVGFLAGSGLTSAYVYFPALPPPPATVLNMGHVIATSLAAESPCTASLFSPPPATILTPSMGLRWSDTRGATWGNAVPQPLSADPLAQPIWNRTGYARDRVFELFWSFAFKTALNGAFVDVEPFDS